MTQQYSIRQHHIRGEELVYHAHADFTSYEWSSRPNRGLPHLQKVVPFPPPALVGTTLASVTTVTRILIDDALDLS